jgi:hypothetical protein
MRRLLQEHVRVTAAEFETVDPGEGNARFVPPFLQQPLKASGGILAVVNNENVQHRICALCGQVSE